MNLPAQNKHLIGVASLAMGVIVFSLQDAIMKAMSGDHAVTLAIVVRCLVALPILLVMVQIELGLGRLLSRNAGVLIPRGMILLVAYTTYYMALPALPLAEAIALFFTAPLIITLLPARCSAKGKPASLGCRDRRVHRCTHHPAPRVGALRACSAAQPPECHDLCPVHGHGAAHRGRAATVMAFYVNAVYLLGAVCGNRLCHGRHQDSAIRASTSWSGPGPCQESRPDVDGSLRGHCGLRHVTSDPRLSSAKAILVTVFEYTGMIWGPLWGFLFFGEIPS